jgi:phosphoribosyl 1,2-cyclic phosphodiesterase
VKRLVLFHHEQTHSDEKVDEILNTCLREIRTRNYKFECIAATEGMELDW